MCIGTSLLEIHVLYRLHHDVEVGIGFIQLKAKGPRIM